MAIIDIIILAAFGLGAIIGFMKGFVKQLASLLGLIVGLLAAKALYASLAVKLCPMLTDSMTVAQVLAFVFIWLAVPLLFSPVGKALDFPYAEMDRVAKMVPMELNITIDRALHVE